MHNLEEGKLTILQYLFVYQLLHTVNWKHGYSNLNFDACNTMPSIVTCVVLVNMVILEFTCITRNCLEIGLMFISTYYW